MDSTSLLLSELHWSISFQLTMKKLQQSQVQFFAANSRVAYSVHYGKVYALHKAVVDGVESRKPQLNFCM